MGGGGEPYKFLLDRCQSLEVSHKKLREQFKILLQENDKNNVKNSKNEGDTSDSCEMTLYSGRGYVPGVFFEGSPYRRVLDQMGHAVHVSRAGTGDIIFWSRAAERLFGYKDYEVLGHTDAELLIDEEHHATAERLMERMNSGHSWSGQFPFKKRSGHIFMALVTRSLLYEDGELVGVITVSSDAAVFNNLKFENVRKYQDPADDESSSKGMNLKKILWQPHPEGALRVPNPASKVHVRKHGDNTCNAWTNASKKEIELDCDHVRFVRPPRAPTARVPPYMLPNGKVETGAESSETNKSADESVWPSKLAAKVLYKLRIGQISNVNRDKGGSMQQNGYNEVSSIKQTSKATKSGNCCIDTDRGWGKPRGDFPFASKTAHIHLNSHMLSNEDFEDRKCSKWAEVLRSADQLSRSSLQSNDKEFKEDIQNSKPLEMENKLQRWPLELQHFPDSVESTGIHNGSSSSRGEKESNWIVNCGIRWEDLNLREEIGAGSYGIVYRGIWNGSEVAVKVYAGNYGNQCSEETFLDYKKEIDIMRRLRHPNVLLFMGAVYSQEILAVVTEYMPRGSLLKTLHKCNQTLDIKRRLRMALDVARGMNYLHRRNPPIVHRDLKSSNLLVDKSWTVKVGDFGLSKFKMATLSSTKSGRGTPQWMAPEVLRSERSTEKSDVFSFGVVLWELMTDSVPWNDLNPLQIVAVVGFMDRGLDIPGNLDPGVSSIIRDCWLSNPEQRPSFEEIIHRMTNLIRTVTGETAKRSKGPPD